MNGFVDELLRFETEIVKIVQFKRELEVVCNSGSWCMYTIQKRGAGDPVIEV